MHLVVNDAFSAVTEHESSPLIAFVSYMYFNGERVTLCNVDLEDEELVYNIE